MAYRTIRYPYRMTAKYAGQCAGCSAQIKRGDSILWNPARKRAYCPTCADAYDRQARREVAYERYGSDCALDC